MNIGIIAASRLRAKSPFKLKLITPAFQFARFYITSYYLLDAEGISSYEVFQDNVSIISNNTTADFYIEDLLENTTYEIKAVITLNNAEVFTFIEVFSTPTKNTNTFFNDVTSYYPMGEVGNVPFQQRFENILDKNTYLYAASNLNDGYQSSPVGPIGPTTFFNGKRDCEAYRNNSNLIKDTTVGFSVCFIVSNFGNNTEEPAIMSMYKNSGAVRRFARFGLEISSDGKLQHWSGYIVRKGSTVISDGNPHIIFMIQDQVNDTLKYYVDNNLEISVSAQVFQTIQDSRTTFGGYDNLTILNSTINLSGILYKESVMTQSDRSYLYNNGNYRKLNI
jgi:hypothetical protein